MALVPSAHLFFFCAFLLHRLLFVTAGRAPLRPSSSHNPDIAPLLAFKRSLSRPASAELSSWDPATDPCSWRGVCCRGGRVARLVLEDLRLDGPIDHLARLHGLALLSLTNNSFSSPLHRLDLSRSPWRAHLKILHLSHNRFSGPFPEDLLGLRRLRRLDLAGNLISGSIPLEIGLLLRRLLTLRLEKNELSGLVPFSVGSIPELTDLNVSHNRLEGKIPGKLSHFPPSSFVANPGLCGAPLPRRCSNNLTVIGGVRMPPRRANGRNRRKWVVAIAAAAAAISAAIAASVAALWCLKRRAKKRKGRKSEDIGERGKEEEEEEEEEAEVVERGGRMEWFEEEQGGFALDDLMRGSAEMLGRGAVGSTYRVVMEGTEAPVAVVVKRVRRRKEKRRKKEEAEEELLREMGRWRHPNVVRLRAYHHSSAGEELLLVYDYLPNGSLYNLLHGSRGPGRIPLEWTSRLKLALGAAKGLAYLHGASNSRLSHQHLTSSNVLVDGDGNARISDFALLELLSPPTTPSSSFNSASSHVASATETAQRGDVYSFGIILLEMLTGRPAVATSGEEELAKWVRTVVREEWTAEVFDIELMRDAAAEDEMFALLQVALLCVAEEASNRPRMGVVCKMIEDIMERGESEEQGIDFPFFAARAFVRFLVAYRV